MIGQVHGRLTVTGRATSDKAGARWRCRCECGQDTIVRGLHLRNGAIASCGCLNRETLRKPDGQITYNSAHYRVKRAKGYPSQHACAHCGAPAAHWALRAEAPVTHVGDDGRGTPVRYSGNPDDYFPLCAVCHRRYDRPPA
jgi:hypothetical protein